MLFGVQRAHIQQTKIIIFLFLGSFGSCLLSIRHFRSDRVRDSDDSNEHWPRGARQTAFLHRFCFCCGSRKTETQERSGRAERHSKAYVITLFTVKQPKNVNASAAVCFSLDHLTHSHSSCSSSLCVEQQKPHALAETRQTSGEDM